MKTPLLTLLALLSMNFLTSGLHAESSERNLELFSGTTWRFNAGKEFKPGGEGSFALAQDDGKNIGILKYQFENGGAYVGGRTDLVIENEDFTEIRFQAKSDSAQKLSVRFIDNTKQWHQIKLKYSKVGEWELFRIPLRGESYSHFGGANDGVIHFPINILEFLVSNSADNSDGEVKFTDAKLVR